MALPQLVTFQPGANLATASEMSIALGVDFRDRGAAERGIESVGTSWK
jgi:hypothetical protein